ncbi:21671_t:CDS:1, partial [Entrophospora sp. SA101]
ATIIEKENCFDHPEDELFLTEMNQDFNFCGKNVHPADDTQSKWHLLSLFDSNLEPPTFLE